MRRFRQKQDLYYDSQRRVLAFKRISNFRDLGGYPATGGAQVKWGILYRSGHLANMKAADYKRFEALNIQTVIDFRSELEKEREPSRLPGFYDNKILWLPILDPGSSPWAEELRTAIETNNFQGVDPSEKMGEFYQDFAVEYVEQFKRFVHAVLAAEGQPVLWHCTSGKDRTGFAAAILLRLLGVSQDTILKDYLLSAKYADRRKNLIFLLRLTRGKEVAQIVQKLLLVQKDWIETAFESIDKQWGSFERYSHEALELSEERINQLRNFLLMGTA